MLGILFILLSFSSVSLNALEFNMPFGASEISQNVYDLHMFVFYICLIIGVFVVAVLLWSVIRYRKSAHPVPAKFHESLKLEILWTIVPFIILFIIGYPAANLIIKMYDTSASEVDIQITGYQWKWSYKYLNEGIEFFSHLKTPYDQTYQTPSNDLPKDYLLDVDNPVVVPVGVKVRFLTTSADVVHSWWVPDLAIKRDAIPGFINEAWAFIKKPGTYYGRCAELCGKGHGYMPIAVKAVSLEEYKEWIKYKTKIERY